jgi:hypothetical protein
VTVAHVEMAGVVWLTIFPEAYLSALELSPPERSQERTRPGEAHTAGVEGARPLARAGFPPEIAWPSRRSRDRDDER